MNVAYQFLKDESFSNSLLKNLDFLLDVSLFEVLDLYRVMKKQTELNEIIKMNAHDELQKIRLTEEGIKLTGQKLSEKEKLELNEQKEFLKKLREKEKPLYYKGKVIEYDQLTNAILKCEKVLYYLDGFVSKIQHKIASQVRSIMDKKIPDIKKSCQKRSKKTKSETGKKFLTKFEKILDYLPEKLLNSISGDINLEDHIPKETPEKKQKDGEFEINLSF